MVTEDDLRRWHQQGFSFCESPSFGLEQVGLVYHLPGLTLLNQRPREAWFSTPLLTRESSAFPYLSFDWCNSWWYLRVMVARAAYLRRCKVKSSDY